MRGISTKFSKGVRTVLCRDDGTARTGAPGIYFRLLMVANSGEMQPRSNMSMALGPVCEFLIRPEATVAGVYRRPLANWEFQPKLTTALVSKPAQKPTGTPVQRFQSSCSPSLYIAHRPRSPRARKRASHLVALPDPAPLRRQGVGTLLPASNVRSGAVSLLNIA
jgi:hypothetical protein